MTDGYTVATFERMETPNLPQFPRWATVREHFGISSFGVNAWAAKEPGEEVIAEHDELGQSSGQHEELYVVLSGSATFTVDGEETDAPAGTLVFVRDRAARRKAVAHAAGTTILVIGARPGEPFSTSAWERSAPAFRYFATKEHDKAREILLRVLAEHPDDSAVNFNLACAESLLGMTDEAVAHLRRAIDLDERFRELARKDGDFDAIRDDAAFRELVG